MNFGFQRVTVLDVMVGCPLMEGIREIKSIPNRQIPRNPKRRFGLDKVLLEQGGKQLLIPYRHWIKLWHPLNIILWGKLLGSLLSRPSLILLLILLKMGLITRILNNVGGGHNNIEMLITRIPLLRPLLEKRLILCNHQ